MDTTKITIHTALDHLSKRRTTTEGFKRYFGNDVLEGLYNNSYVDIVGTEVQLTVAGARYLLDLEGFRNVR